MRALRSRSVEWVLGVALTAAASFASAQAPIVDGGQPVSRSSRSSAGAQDSGAQSATGALYQQLQTLQQEVSELRGIVEEQRHQLETLKQQSLDRYTDIDNRLSQGQGQPQSQPAPGSVAPGAAIPADGPVVEPAPASTAPAATAPAAATTGMQTARPEEYEAYQKAFTKLKGQDFGGAIKDFNSFLATYPKSTLAGNSYYWLGKAYLSSQGGEAKAQQAFTKVVSEQPQHVKAPESLYELGKLAFKSGDKAKAKVLMQQVIDTYGTSGSSAPQLAKQFLDQNFK